MKSKTTVILVLLLLCCVAAVLVLQTNWFSAPSKNQEAKRVLQPMSGKIVSVRVVSDAGAETLLVRDKDHWRLEKPFAARANDASASSFADSLASMAYLRKIEAKDKDADAAVTGLDKPLWTVTLTDDQQNSRTMRVGKTVPLKRRQTYVGGADEKAVYVVDFDLVATLQAPGDALRDRGVFELNGGRIERLGVQSARRNLELERVEGEWKLTQPVAAKADEQAANKLIDIVLGLRAGNFLSESPERLVEYGLDKPALLVRVWISEPEATTTAPATAPATSTATAGAPAVKTAERVLALGRSAGGEVYAKLQNSPSVFTLPASVLKDLQVDATELRQRKLLDVQQDLVAGVDVQTPAGKASLKKKDDQWTMVEPQSGKANEKQVDDLLGALSALQAESFEDAAAPADLARFGLTKPRGRIVVHQAGLDHPRTLQIGGTSSSGERAFVRLDEQASVAVVKTEALAPLLTEPAAYWTSTLLELPDPHTIRTLAVVRGDSEMVLRNGEKGWSIVKPLVSDVDQEHLNKILDHLEKLTATKIVALGPKVPEEYRKVTDLISVALAVELPAASQPATSTARGEKPAASAPSATTQPATSQPTATTAPKTVTYALRIGRLNGQIFAWMENQKVVAVGLCSEQLFNDFSAELRQRTVLKIKGESVRRIAIEAGKDSLTLQRGAEKDSWAAPSDRYVRIEPEKVANYLQGLERIQAVKFFGLNLGDVARFGLDKPWLRVELSGEDFSPIVVTLSNKGEDGGKYATVSGVPGVMLLSAEDAAKFARKLESFAKQ